MGDAAAAAIVTPTDDPGAGLLASTFGNDGTRLHMATLERSGLTGRPERLEFGVGGRDIAAEAVQNTVRSTQAVLEAADHTLAEHDVRWLLPHQPNGALLTDFLATLEVSESRSLRVVDEIGSVGAASVAVALDHLFRSPAFTPGDAIALSAVGGGTAWGGLLIRTPA